MKKTTLIISGSVPKDAGTVIAVGGAASKVEADWHAYVEKPKKLAKGSPKVCCHGKLVRGSALALNPTKQSWNSDVNIALALAAYLRSTIVVIVGFDILATEDQEALLKEARLLCLPVST